MNIPMPDSSRESIMWLFCAKGYLMRYFAEDSHLDGARQEQIEKTLMVGVVKVEQMEFAEDFFMMFSPFTTFFGIFRNNLGRCC